MVLKRKEQKGSTPGQETRMQLIRVAVRHFAKDGFAAASQRAIQREAGVNAAAAHYHFGSKAALYEAVIKNFIDGVQEERVRRHGELSPDISGKARLRQLLFDYFWPGIAIAADEEGYHYALILARLQGEAPGEAAQIFSEAARPVREIYMESLVKLYPDVPVRELNTFVAAGVALMATTPRRNPPDFDDPEGYANHHADILARTFSAGMIELHGEPAE